MNKPHFSIEIKMLHHSLIKTRMNILNVTFFAKSFQTGVNIEYNIP